MILNPANYYNLSFPSSPNVSILSIIIVYRFVLFEILMAKLYLSVTFQLGHEQEGNAYRH